MFLRLIVSSRYVRNDFFFSPPPLFCLHAAQQFSNEQHLLQPTTTTPYPPCSNMTTLKQTDYLLPATDGPENPDFFATSNVSSLNFTPTLIHSKNTIASSGVVPNRSAKSLTDTPPSFPRMVSSSDISSAFLSRPYLRRIRSNSAL